MHHMMVANRGHGVKTPHILNLGMILNGQGAESTQSHSGEVARNQTSSCPAHLILILRKQTRSFWDQEFPSLCRGIQNKRFHRMYILP